MTTLDQLDAIDALADTGDLPGALAQARALRAACDAEEAPSVQVLLGSLTARQGEFAPALELLEEARSLAQAADQPEVEAESQVMTASIYAAMGDYDMAVPLLRATVELLRVLQGEDDELLADAEAELVAYETLLGQ